MDVGLKSNNAPMAMIPSYVSKLPTGSEKGTFLAVDLGGTNFRVCSVSLQGDGKYHITQEKVTIPKELMVGTSKMLFSFLSQRVKDFLAKHHGVHFLEDKEHHFKMGFTFSFPVEQKAIDEGYLIRWTKGFDIRDTVGMNVCQLLQAELDDIGCPVRVTALINDTVGTLMARSYTSGPSRNTLLGAIFGTGTNGAYLERNNAIPKLDDSEGRPSDFMVINTEWGAFDNELKVLPNTVFDQQLDAASNNIGMQMFEKRVSGMFLGEILRLSLVYLHEHNVFLTSEACVSPGKLVVPWVLDSSILSIAVADTSSELSNISVALADMLSVTGANRVDLETVKNISLAIGRRSARLAAVAIAATALKIKSNDASMMEMDVGVDGSLIEFFPNYQDYVHEAILEIFAAKGETIIINLGLARDGSGVGAALTALVSA